MTYTGGLAPIVTVYGPGNLHHLSYAGGVPNAVGMIPTTNNGTTNIILGFSIGYLNYAFYWDGEGPAFWRVAGNSTIREPVGTSWKDATGVPWGTEIILGEDVSAQVAIAGNKGNEVTVYLIPDDLD